MAFYYGHLPSARILLNKKAQLEATDCNGLTPAHCAVDANQLEMVKFALDSGANLEARDACQWTLLMRAGELSPTSSVLTAAAPSTVVMDASLELIKLLVTHGAELEARDALGKSCRDLARLYRRTEVADYFEKLHRFRLAKLQPQAAQGD